MTSRGDRDEGFYRSLDGSTLVSDDISSAPNELPSDPEERAVLEQQWKTELSRLEAEISTLTSVLNVKQRQVADLKHRLGITPLAEMKKDLEYGLQTVRDSRVVKTTNEKLHQIGETISSSDAYQKTSSAIQSFGSFASRKLGDIRNSGVVKSMEEKVGDAYTSVKQSQSVENFKTKVTSLTMPGSRSAGNVNEGPTSPVDSLNDDDEVYASSSRQRSGYMK